MKTQEGCEPVLPEFKCPFKREIAKNHIPSYYRDQIQTGLALSGESVKKGLFVNNCFRICSLQQIEPSSSHNPTINGEKYIMPKMDQLLHGVFVTFYSKTQKLGPKQKNIIGLGSAKYSKPFEKIITSVAEKEIFCAYGDVRATFTKADEYMEFFNIVRDEKTFHRQGHSDTFSCGGFCLETS